MPGFMIATFVVTLLALGMLRALGFVRRAREVGAYLAIGALAEVGWLGVTSFEATESTLAFIARVVAMSWTVACLVLLVGGALFLVARGILALAVRMRARSRAQASVRPVDIGRRRLLAGVVPVAALGTSARGSVGGLSQFVVRHEEVRVPNLPAALDGFRIGQITDVHVGPFVSVADLESAVRALDDDVLGGSGIDLLAMTGDLLDDIDELEPCLDALEGTKARHGCIAVLGNHEMWRGHERILEAYAQRGERGRLRLLVDQSEALAHTRAADAASLRVVDVDWPSRSRKRGKLEPNERVTRMQQSAAKAFSDVVPGETVLCLTHHPDFFPFAVEKRAALTLAGHTHGGQVAFFGVPLFNFAFEYMLGRFEKSGAHLYVAGGTGHWLPFRLGVPTEVTVITLRPA